MVLLCDRLVAEADGLVLLVPLSQDVLELAAHVVLDVLDFTSAPEVGALVQDDACLAPREGLNAPSRNVLNDRGEDVAKARLPLHFVHLHELVVYEGRRS